MADVNVTFGETCCVTGCSLATACELVELCTERRRDEVTIGGGFEPKLRWRMKLCFDASDWRRTELPVCGSIDRCNSGGGFRIPSVIASSTCRSSFSMASSPCVFSPVVATYPVPPARR